MRVDICTNLWNCYSSFYLPKVVAITGHKSEHRMTQKTLENSHFWQKGSALWQDQI